MAISFNGRGAKKIGGRKGEDIYRSVVALREILSDGKIIETMGDRAERENVKAIHKIAATISISGKPVSLIATVREMNDGTFHYDLSKDFEGEVKSSAGLTAQSELRASALEGDLTDINLDYVSGEINGAAPVPVAALRDIGAALAAEVKASGLEGKVSPALVRNLPGGAGVPIQDRQAGAVIEVSLVLKQDRRRITCGRFLCGVLRSGYPRIFAASRRVLHR